MPKRLPSATDCNQLTDLKTRLLTISLEKRTQALTDLINEVDDGRSRSIERLAVLDVLLFVTDDYTGSDLERLLRKTDLPLLVQRGLRLYQMMRKLMAVCGPKGDRVGPPCGVKRFDRSQLKTLSQGDQQLEVKTRPFFTGRRTPTLQSLAGEVLTEDGERGYSRRNVVRSIRAVRRYTFNDHDPRREYMITTVNAFGRKLHFNTTEIATAAAGLVSVRRALVDLSSSPAFVGLRGTLLDIERRAAANAVSVIFAPDSAFLTTLKSILALQSRILLPQITNMQRSHFQEELERMRKIAESVLKASPIVGQR